MKKRKRIIKIKYVFRDTRIMIVIESSEEDILSNHPIEIVERKGIGHPDSIADGLAEAVSRGLSRKYLDEFGKILHHNTDECQIIAGKSNPVFGGGKIENPIRIILAGRATQYVDEVIIPVREIALESAQDYLANNFENLNIDSDVMLETGIGEGSFDLRGNFGEGRSEIVRANDTSFGAGYAPFTETEQLVLDSERYINGDLHKRLPKKARAFGRDVKVMGRRIDDEIDLTIATAIIDKYVSCKEDYMEVTAKLEEKVLKFSEKYTDKQVNVFVNTADEPDKGNFYLTCTGLSMENGDDGSVGRGNRCNGLITPMRPMSMEACAGKNPVTHVGKLYNILSKMMAEDIYSKIDDVEEVYVRILSQIGQPISDPQVAHISMKMTKGNTSKVMLENSLKEAEDIANDSLDSIGKLTGMLVDGSIEVF